MIEITEKPISPELVVNRVKTDSSGCVVTYIGFTHRVGRLRVGDINLVIAVASARRQEGFATAQYAIDRFKEVMAYS